MKKKSQYDLEIEDHRAKQKAEKDAELAAKLALVEEKTAPTYGRRPKRIGEIVVDTGVKNGYREESATFVLRLDNETFIAEHGDIWYLSKSKAALIAKMEIVGKITLDLVWTKYIVLEYTAKTSHDRYDRDSEIDIGERRKNRRVHGISLAWEVVEYSNEFTVPGGESRFMKRETDDDGETSQEAASHLPGHRVVYTPERVALLESIVDTITGVDAKLVELFRGDEEILAKQLDRIGGAFLLAAGEAPHPAKATRRGRGKAA